MAVFRNTSKVHGIPRHYCAASRDTAVSAGPALVYIAVYVLPQQPLSLQSNFVDLMGALC